MESEFSIERQVEGALRKGEQPGMAGAPGIELRADRLDQAFGDAAALPVGVDRQRPEKPDAAPAGDEIGADQFAVQLRREAGDMLRSEAAIDEVAVSPESLQVRRPKKRAEGGVDDAPGRCQVGLGQRSNDGAHLASNVEWETGNSRPPGTG